MHMAAIWTKPISTEILTTTHIDTAAEQLRTALPAVTVSVSDVRTDPWDFLVVQ